MSDVYTDFPQPSGALRPIRDDPDDAVKFADARALARLRAGSGLASEFGGDVGFVGPKPVRPVGP